MQLGGLPSHELAGPTHPLLVTAILPLHEVTHVVLADVFTGISNLADEESLLKQSRTPSKRPAAELNEPPAQAGRLRPAQAGWPWTTPMPRTEPVLRSERASVTRFSRTRPPEKFVQFVQNSQRNGTEASRHLWNQRNLLAELQDRWISTTATTACTSKEAATRGFQPAGIEVK